MGKQTVAKEHVRRVKVKSICDLQFNVSFRFMSVHLKKENAPSIYLHVHR